MATTKKLVSMKLSASTRSLAKALCDAHRVNFTELVEGLIALDTALTTGVFSKRDMPHWVLYEFPIEDLQDAIGRMRKKRRHA